MISPGITIQGLSDTDVLYSRQQHGNNALQTSEEKTLLHVLKDVALEPMFIMSLAACMVYFFMRQYDEGIIMLLSIFIVAGISFSQEYRSRNAILALRKLSAPKAKLIRNGNILDI